MVAARNVSECYNSVINAKSRGGAARACFHRDDFG